MKRNNKPSWVARIYKQLRVQHGEQSWWPADTPFEIMAGAILTQNTAWSNVERVLQNLKNKNMLSAHAIVSATNSKLARVIRSAGYHNIKSTRLKNFCTWYINNGEYESIKYWSTPRLRDALLSINGVGRETADDILLYAFNRRIFVIDNYTRRMSYRLGKINGQENYEQLRAIFESALPGTPKLYGELHALIVQHSKYVCKSKPQCSVCQLQTMCQQRVR